MPVTTTKIDLHPLYGIIATQKSYLIGIRCLIATHHAQMMASRIMPPYFPDELVSTVADRLADFAELQIRSLWDATTDWDDRLLKFGIAQLAKVGGRTPAERAAMAQLENLNVAVISIPISKCADRPAHWIHLSAADIRPQFYTNKPSTRHPGTRGMVSWLRAYCCLDTGTGSGRDRLDFVPEKLAVDCIVFQRDWEPPSVPVRLVQFNGLEEAMKAWKQDDVEKFVALLKIGVVATVGEKGNGMLPKIRLLHVIKGE
ncbi:hypothetical protein B0A48_11249 [Cryoendolithus antarcticus]|uniref:Uncharacterized protein n=1 Tax=Cryoendolithus antarcticus TaxID=1507870 RepID=A0A1V8SUZ0_9PEZI|nr:hypothetical protein B0A48_11249 [Cryoendolithus antarcticus]